MFTRSLAISAMQLISIAMHANDVRNYLYVPTLMMTS
jgi:hypothetical protein